RELTLTQYLESYTEFTVVDKIFGRKKKKNVTNTTTKDSLESGDIEPQLGRIFPNEVLKVNNRGAIREFDNRLQYKANATTGLIEIGFDLQDANAGAEVLQNIVAELINV